MHEEKENPSEDLLRLQTTLSLLGEHFDGVHIFATRHTPNGTLSFSKGIGNWFARYGQIKAWVKTEENEDNMLYDKTDESDDL